MELRTITPLWTGGKNGKVDRIHETALLGSMRWWYAALVRGVGGYDCDRLRVKNKTDSNRCQFNEEKYRKSISNGDDERQRLREAGLCDVCQLFGATSWKRRFRLSVVERADGRRSISEQDGIPAGEKFTIQIENLDFNYSADIIYGLIRFIADWGVIGAKTQSGFGYFEHMDSCFDAQPLYDHLMITTGSQPYDNSPSIQNMFFARIQLKQDKGEAQSNIKSELKNLLSSREQVDYIFGAKGSKQIPAKIKISRPYDNGIVRIWGWIPEKAASVKNWDRNTVLNAVHNHLKEYYELEIWREFNSERDTESKNNDDIRQYLGSLLGVREK